MTHGTAAVHASARARRLEDLFPGPNPFSEKQGDLFFGRAREMDELRSLLQAYRTVLLHAQSGAGKTSLVRAGLFPKLAAEGVQWTHCRVASPSTEVPEGANAFVRAVLLTGRGPEAARCGSLAEAFDFLDHEAEHVLVFDQFEEFFTFYPDRWAEREPFFSQISDLLESNNRIRMLFVIREEFVSRLEPFAHHMPEEFQIRLFLERLRAEQAKQAVRGPFRREGVEFDSEALLDWFIDSLRRQVNAADGGPGGKSKAREYKGEFVEPVQLQVVCHSLAQGISLEATRITKGDVELHGNPGRSLMQFYEDAVKSVARDRRIRTARLRNWFDEGLITVGGTRGTLFMGEIDTNGLDNGVVQALEAAHIIRSERRAGAVWCEITHDLLLAPIQESNLLWRSRRKRVMLLSIVSAAFLLVVAVGFRFLLSRQQSDTTKLVEDTKREVTSQTRQSTAAEFFERTVVVEAQNPVIRKTQKAVANLLADFFADASTNRDIALQHLNAGLKTAWDQDGIHTIGSIDRGLDLYPKMKDDLTWPALTEDVRECRRSLLASLTSQQWQQTDLRDYVRGHNAGIVMATADVATSAYELSVWRKRFPYAILSPALPDTAAAPKPAGFKLVVIDYFLSCPEAVDLTKKLNANETYGQKRPFVVSYYSDCPSCGYYLRYYLLASPPRASQAALP